MEEDIFEWMVHCPRSSSWKRKGRGSLISEQRTCPLRFPVMGGSQNNKSFAYKWDTIWPIVSPGLRDFISARGCSQYVAERLPTVSSKTLYGSLPPKSPIFNQGESVRPTTNSDELFLFRNSCTIRCESRANSASVRARPSHRPPSHHGRDAAQYREMETSVSPI